MTKIIPAILVIALATIACGFSVNLPARPTPEAERTDQITVAAPEPAPSGVEGSGETRLTLAFGAGELTLSPGAQNLVNGTTTYNVPELKPEIVTQGNAVEIKQGDLKGILYPDQVKNEWDLKLGSTPMDLTINAGAYKGEYELGGLSLTGLTIKDGASTLELSFSQSNRTEMAVLRYETGASNAKLRGLANANFGTMIFNGGAGDYTLDFSGTLKRNATITVSAGLSNLILVIPESVRANVTVESGVSNVNAGPGWSQNGNLYSQNSQSSTGPRLTFLVKTGAGNLTLTH
jgi:hypothetical protein